MKKKIFRKVITDEVKVNSGVNRLIFSSKQDEMGILKKYNTSYSGYEESKVELMREKYGKNEITHQKGDSLLKRLVEAFINPFTIILLALAIISFITDIVIVGPSEKDATSVIIVTSMVLVSGILRFVQETKSNKAAEKLSEMVKTTISVERKGVGAKEIPINEIVVGDIIHLAAGDMIPADVRILKAKDLFVSQSSLTGESEPIEKVDTIIIGDSKNPIELNNLAFMGSNVISGSAIAIVINVGDDTIFGSMAKQLVGKKVTTSFEKGVNSVSWVLIRFMLVMVPFVLFMNGFTKGNWMEAFLFALSVAVGLTPEMLPMIVSANLAKGAVSMSKKKVIVKDLNAIQNLGAMDVLCTDKTGTLTQDEVVLEYSLDIHGKEDNRVLRHAFLNSYHQTGLKNLMDIAIVNHANEKDMIELWHDYKKVDEIPFDFSRRRMSVVVEDKAGKTQLITKGAIEEMLSVCSHVEYKGKIETITEEIKKEILDTVSSYNSQGMRILGIAQKNNPSSVGELSVKDESDMVLIGYLAFLDPPKKSTANAIRALEDFGVNVKILTGDNDAVTSSVCKQVGIKVNNLLLGSDIEEMDDELLSEVVEETNVFAKLSPNQKTRVVSALRNNGHTVGFMGDGINDAAAMTESDVGISVDTAVDIAKESANIILLEKDLMVLEDGVVEGRKIYANIIKYIKMTASSNFGNMFSVLVASIFLPFLPMLPIQLLILNLIYDISCITIPWDNVDEDYLKLPRKWDASSISKFMFWIGPTSSVFDIATYILMYFFICPLVFGGQYYTLNEVQQLGFMGLFHAGWFVESLWSQTLVIHMIRTPDIPFIQSRASWQLTTLTTLGIAVGTIIPYTAFGKALDMVAMPAIYFPCLIVIIILYMILATILKKAFIKRYGELL
ncbi:MULTISPECIES: magnesium-translocating P-type ATPase [Clostridium]|jgi:Mg2+-importing ATPase|uniref:Magnesium-transporting ATPase, P-type 1 n=1 Tax=Clostridium tertium TaxID=1559 RepID=A0A9X4B429_9CLOT|nr:MULTISPECIES: magnesium-translocating P-type ATPase [Clostridium]MBU6136565.1 magnesium-translocating P-type ATPase [Clostridium tertium]MDB1946854.1 magnesium-translocating P-type ATPase [Clostridium tertium]MDB1969964.1 magnesium-translocating P-type ATPase [Clostridium tertium]MDC4241793.1 magnesium-translocating P-type ATPase [Clostridium tertium]MDU4737688.1 magnesium-translocating P-type ATPase [Clostridium sp.]